MGALIGWPSAQHFQPASLFAFLFAACLFWQLSTLKLENPLAALPQLTPDNSHQPTS
jgi:hypothetical protein